MTAPSPPANGCHPPSGPNNPSPTAELTALTAHLRRLVDRVNDLDNRCNDLSDTLAATVLPRLDRIATDTAAQLAEHHDYVHSLLDTLTTQRATEPPNWPAMTVEQAVVAWDDLAEWIADTFVPWYEITRDRLPDCWALHRPAVLHLGWLHHAYQGAHQPGAGPRSTADWHTRWLPAALRAVHDAIPDAAHEAAAQATTSPPTPTAPSSNLHQLTHRQRGRPYPVTNSLNATTGRPSTDTAVAADLFERQSR